MPRATPHRAAFKFGLLFVQGGLPHLRGIVPAVAALHPVTGRLVFWVAVVAAREAHALKWASRLPSGIARLAHASKS